MDTWDVTGERLLRITALAEEIAEVGPQPSRTASTSASPQPTASS